MPVVQSMNSQSAQMAPARLASKTGHLVLVALTCFAGAFYVPNASLGLALFTLGLTFISLSILGRVSIARRQARQEKLNREVARMVGSDMAANFTTDAEGRIEYLNDSAVTRFGEAHDTVSMALSKHLLAPNDTLRRLRMKAEAKGFAREEIATKSGVLRISVHRIAEGNLLWRVEEMSERTAQGRGSDSITLPMMTVSKAGTVLFMNDAMRRILGGRPAHIDRIFNDLPLRPDQVHVVSGVQGTFRARVHVIDGAIGRKEIYVLPVDAVEEQAGQTWHGLEALPIPILKVAPDGKIRQCNQLATETLGTTDCVDAYLADLLEGLGRPVSDWLGEAAEKSAQVQSEFVRATKRTDEVFLQITLTRIIENGEPALLVILIDATKIKTLEGQFVQSQKMQAIGQLAGGVAHDFNNLLTAISGHCDLLMLRHDEEDPDFADLQQIHQNANRAASLVGQLLAFSRKQTLKPEVLEVSETLDDLTHLLNRLVGERVTLTVTHAPDLPLIRADKRQLEQVIMNLVVNARDAMPDGGSVRLESRIEHLNEPYVRDRVTVPIGDYVVICVHDQGIGIPPDKLGKIFEPFFTTKNTGEGTGLGLSMAYGIVKQTGGFIFADSVLGSGTSFTLFFPAHVPIEPMVPEVPAKASDPAPVEKAAGGVVLLVEDEAPVRAFASRALKMRGFTVVEADSAENALGMLDDPDLKVDVFVTDVVMPGMDGPSWVAKALEARPETRVVFMSGYAEESFADQQARIPHSTFLPKPFSLTDLAATVQAQVQ